MELDLIPMRGLIFEEKVSDEQAIEYAHRLAELDTTLQWGWARLFAAMEFSYGETYSTVVQISPYSQSTVANMRTIARKIPDYMVRTELSFSHHQAVCDYEMPPYMMEKLLDECVLSSNDNGRVWSVDTFRQIIRERTRLPEPKKDHPSDIIHQQAIENGDLTKRVIESVGVAQLATERLSVAISIIEAANVPDVGEFISETKEFIESPYPYIAPVSGHWSLERRSGGVVHLVFMENTPLGVVEHCMSDLPDQLVADLKKRLSII